MSPGNAIRVSSHKSFMVTWLNVTSFASSNGLAVWSPIAAVVTVKLCANILDYTSQLIV